VPITDVEDTIREACQRWRVQAIVADPFRWARSLQLLAAEGLPVEEYPQSPQRMTPGDATVRRGRAEPGAHPLREPGSRAACRQRYAAVDARGSRIQKEHRHSQRRIDLAVAAVMAHDLAATVETDPQV
jgi:phage terminase large subunit-like protein